MPAQAVYVLLESTKLAGGINKIMIKAIIEAIITTTLLGLLSGWINGNERLYYLIFIPFCFLVYYFLVPRLPKLKQILQLKRRQIFPKIGILTGYINSYKDYPCEKVWTNITPQNWKQKISSVIKNKSALKMINVCDINDSFLIIINPFGDNFPEEDTALHTTFIKIQNFIANGGIFVVTGGAFFWHQDTKRREFKEQPIAHWINGNQALVESLLYKKFGVSTTGNIPGVIDEPLLIETYQTEEDKNIFGDLSTFINNKQLKRFRAVKNTSQRDFIPIIRERNGTAFPVVLVKYGRGYLLHFGLYLEDDQGPELKLAIQIISKLFGKQGKI